MKIISVVGARPNFMKIAPIHRSFINYLIQHPESNIQHFICHTGQHYDEKMSKIFLDDLELTEPDFYLGINNGSHAVQTANIMIEFEKVLLKELPELVIVVGDVNSTVACSLTAVKLGIKVAHVEAGLRSFDRTMPEEVNRILTDSISDFLFVTEKGGLENLKREGIPDSKVYFVGNCMIDSLVHFLPKIDSLFQVTIQNILSSCAKSITKNTELRTKNYVLVTLHRPSNVDDPVQLSKLIHFLNKVAKLHPIIFPLHPRTRKMIKSNSLQITAHPLLIMSEPLGYLEFLSLMKNASLVITDSGGIQEETTFLGIPCITLRTSTERPVTVDAGTNYLIADNLEKAYSTTIDILNGKAKNGSIPELWDGKASERIVNIIIGRK